MSTEDDGARAQAGAVTDSRTPQDSAQDDARVRERAAAIAKMYQSMDEFLAAHVVTQELLEMKISV
ncbi:MAG TPA: hypothetical protein VFO25_08510 [Candidatus Eremiobacteraceae bacterium]|nr:hypothetical protein [Candidatus Eremiobacteraceae bacterium]